ncbi:MAG: hypothetical protein AAF405_00975 [Pseudomonadota bacterium]
MPGMFDKTRPDAAAVRRIKELVVERFNLPQTTTLAVAELRCHEPGCPPVETVVTARAEDGSVQAWRVAKPVSEIETADIETLSTKE